MLYESLSPTEDAHVLFHKGTLATQQICISPYASHSSLKKARLILFIQKCNIYV